MKFGYFATYPIFSVDICKYPPVLGQCGSHMTNMEAGFCLSTVWQFRWPGCAECAFYKPIDGPGDLVRPVCHYCWAVVRLTGFPCLLAYVRSGLFRRAAWSLGRRSPGGLTLFIRNSEVFLLRSIDGRCLPLTDWLRFSLDPFDF